MFCVTCFVCQFNFYAIDQYSTHLHEVHSKLEFFRCTLCPKQFSSKNALITHLQLIHSKISNSTNIPHNTNNNVQSDNFDDTNFIDESFNNSSDFNENFSDTVQNSESIRKMLFNLALFLYGNDKVPKSTSVASLKIIYDMLGLIMKNVNNFCAAEYVDVFGCNLKELEFLKSEYLFSKSVEKCESFVKPENVILLTEIETSTNVDNTILLKNIEYNYQYVSIYETYRSLFNNTKVLDFVLNYLNTLDFNDNFITSFIQSNYWKKKLDNIGEKRNDTLYLPLIIYGDELDPNNSIGSHGSSELIGGVYCSLLCLPPEIACKLNSIFLVMLYYSNDRKKFGNQKMFQHLVDELNFLYSEGIDISKQNVSYTKVKLIFCLFIGDNKGLNEYFDIVASFNAKNFCRFCKMEKCFCREKVFEDESLMRSVVNYNNDVDNLVDNFGIKCSSIFNSIFDFHITDNPALDNLHDYSEGIFKYDMEIIFKELIPKFISIQDLNFRILNFNYPLNFSDNRIPLLNIDFNGKFKMSGEEMYILVHSFGMLVGDKIPKNHKVWDLYLSLRRIIDIAYADILPRNCGNDFNLKISSHHSIYKQVSHLHLKPKYHLTTHSGSVINKIGLLKFSNCSKFESFHCQFKRYAYSCQNRKKLLSTLGTKYSFKFMQKIEELRNCQKFYNIEFGKLKDTDNRLYSNETLSFVYSNIKYKLGCVLNISKNYNCNPKFAIITRIYENNGRCIILLQLLHTIQFNVHFHAYEVSLTDVEVDLDFKELFFKKNTVIHVINSKKFVNW